MLKKILLIVFVIFVTNIFAESKTDSDISNAVLLEKLNSNKMIIQQTENRFELISNKFEETDKHLDKVLRLCYVVLELQQ